MHTSHTPQKKQANPKKDHSTVTFVPNTPTADDFEICKTGGGCLTRGVKKSNFFLDSRFFGVNDNFFLHKQEGGVYRVVIGISDFGQKQEGGVHQGGGCLE